MPSTLSLYIADDFIEAFNEIYDIDSSVNDDLRFIIETLAPYEDLQLIYKEIEEQYYMDDTVMSEIQRHLAWVMSLYRPQMDLKKELCLELECAPPNKALKVGGILYLKGLLWIRRPRDAANLQRRQAGPGGV